MPIAPQTAAAMREARRHLAAARADLNRAESILEASDVARLEEARSFAAVAKIEAGAAALAIDCAVTSAADTIGDNDTATDKPPPRENDTGP